MTARNSLSALSITCLLLTSCATAPVAPPEQKSVSGMKFKITLPAGLEGENELLRGADINEFNNSQQNTNAKSIRYYRNFTIEQDATTSTLITRRCDGTEQTGILADHWWTCVVYKSRVSVSSLEGGYQVEIIPFERTIEKQPNSLGVTRKTPKHTADDWYGLMSHQYLSAKHRGTSQYPPESLKANFDRNLEQRARGGYEDLESALKQYKDVYVLTSPAAGNFTIFGGVSIYPYQNGSLAETEIYGVHSNKKGNSAIDWLSAYGAVMNKLEAVVAE